MRTTPGLTLFIVLAWTSRSHSLAGRQRRVDGRGGGRRARHTRTQLFESISGNRAKITRAMNRLRDALVRARADFEMYAYRGKRFGFAQECYGIVFQRSIFPQRRPGCQCRPGCFCKNLVMSFPKIHFSPVAPSALSRKRAPRNDRIPARYQSAYRSALVPWASLGQSPAVAPLRSRHTRR